MRAIAWSFSKSTDSTVASLTGCGSDFAIAGNESLTSIYNKDKKIGRRDCTTPPFEHEVVQGVIALAEHAAGVDELELPATPFGRVRDDIPRGSGHTGHDGAAPAREAIEERRLADVRTPHQHDRKVSSAIHLTV